MTVKNHRNQTRKTESLLLREFPSQKPEEGEEGMTYCMSVYQNLYWVCVYCGFIQ